MPEPREPGDPLPDDVPPGSLLAGDPLPDDVLPDDDDSTVSTIRIPACRRSRLRRPSRPDRGGWSSPRARSSGASTGSSPTGPGCRGRSSSA